jgi:hypothetical protein
MMMVGENRNNKAPTRKKGSKGSDRVNGAISRFNKGVEELDEGIMDEDSLVDETDKINFKDELIEGHFKKPSEIEDEISWKEEEAVPIHELVIRNRKDRGLKKRK